MRKLRLTDMKCVGEKGDEGAESQLVSSYGIGLGNRTLSEYMVETAPFVHIKICNDGRSVRWGAPIIIFAFE